MTSTQINLTSVGKKFVDIAKSKLSVFASAFMLPIATLAITSLLITLGGAVEGWFTGSNIAKLGYILKNFSYPILQALPLLFCVSFAITYSKNDAFAVWCAIIAYLAFIYIQSTFIDEINPAANKRQFNILWASQLTGNHVHRVFGVYTLNTSFIAGFLIGAIIIPYLFRNHANVKLPQLLVFFEGKRFLPLLSVLCMWPLTMLFVVVWPWFLTALNNLGTGILTMNAKTYGLDAFIFGVLERALVPFGLHHAFYSPLWFTSAGGDVIHALHQKDTSQIITTYTNTQTWSIAPTAKEFFQRMIYDGVAPFSNWQGDSFIGLSTVGLPSHTINSKPIFQYFQDDLGVNVGRFTSGKYPGMQFGLTSAGLAMIYAAPKNRRKEAFKQIMPGIITVFTMGMTEPLEFLFLFNAPKLFFGVHTLLMGVSFMLMSAFGAHITSAFSGGFFEFIIFGVIPYAKGTQFYWWIVVGAIVAPMYFTSFYWYITKYNVPTPGRDEVEVTTTEETTTVSEITTETVTVTETEVAAESSTEANEVVAPQEESQVPEQTRKFAIALGGWDNMEELANCATRLRYTVKSKELVKDADLKKAGAIAVKWINDNHLQIIVGPKAESINNEMIKWKGQAL